MNNIYTINDLLKTAAVAFNDGDVDTIHNLISVAEGWLQPEAERNAQVTLLESLLKGIEDISSLDHEVLVLEDEVSVLTEQLQGE